MLPIKKKLIKYNHSSRNGQFIKYIVIHDTGNSRAGADAEAHYKYFNGGDRQASAHYFVDDKGILQLVEDSQASWHCGDGKGKYGITNQNSIGVEICINADGDYEKAVTNTVDLVKHLMDKHSIPPDRVVRHYDASRKICPATMRENNWARWQAFKKSLTEQPMDDLAKALKVLVDRGIINTPDYWQQNARVGKTVNGAYAAALIEKVAAFLEKNPPP